MEKGGTEMQDLEQAWADSGLPDEVRKYEVFLRLVGPNEAFRLMGAIRKACRLPATQVNNYDLDHLIGVTVRGFALNVHSLAWAPVWGSFFGYGPELREVERDGQLELALADRAPEGAALGESSRLNGRATGGTGLTPAAVHSELVVEVAEHAVGLPVVVERGAARVNGIGKHGLDGTDELIALFKANLTGGSGRVDAHQEKAL